ncbi:MAG: EF-hand domain-containing protein [Pseudomonadota bacterium]
MKKFLITATAGAIAVAGIAQAAPQTAAAKTGRPGMTKIETRAEVPTQIQQMFAKLDANKDGFISKQESDAARGQMAGKIAKAAKKFDGNKVFDRLDTNKDGTITQAEADAVQKARVAAKGGQAKGDSSRLFARVDANKDGSITRAEFAAIATRMNARLEKAALGRGNMAERFFETADANKDGKVSAAEAQQVALQRFDRADLNRDGKLTPEERKQSRQQLRAQRKS